MQSQNQCMSMFRQEIIDLVRTTVEETMTELEKESADSLAKSMPDVSRPPPNHSRRQPNMNEAMLLMPESAAMKVVLSR